MLNHFNLVHLLKKLTFKKRLLGYSRVEGFTNQLKDEYGVAVVDSIVAVAESSDAILLELVDGRVHLEQFRKKASYGKGFCICAT
jgi:hypothetical protein